MCVCLSCNEVGGTVDKLMFVCSLVCQPVEGQCGLVDDREERGSSPLEGDSPEHNEGEEEASPPPFLHEPVVAPNEGKARQHMFSSM